MKCIKLDKKILHWKTRVCVNCSFLFLSTMLQYNIQLTYNILTTISLIIPNMTIVIEQKVMGT